MQTAAQPGDEPTPQDIAGLLAAAERIAADHAPAAEPTAPPAPDVQDAPAPLFAPGEGDTKRVRKLRAEVAESHRLADLQDDETPLVLDTPKVRRRRKKALEAARLHQLAHDPAALAYRDAKVRRLTTSMTLGAAGIALAASSIGVQASVAKALELREDSPAWWAAYGVEAGLSMPLLAALTVQAYSAIRGRVVDRKSPEGRKLFWTEASLLSLTLILNCWPALKIDDFSLLDLIVHSLGPIAAVIAVWVLPTLWKILSDLPVAWLSTPPGTPPVHPPYRANAQDQYTPGTPPVQVLADHIRAMIQTGALPPNPGVHKIRKALAATGVQVGAEKAGEVQKLIAGGAS